MKIGKLFHLAHLVGDLDATDRLYDDVFGGQRYYRGFEPRAHREASLVVVADQCFEPIAPSERPEDVHTPLRRFRTKFGNRFHSIAWYTDDVVALAARLLARDVRLVDLSGRPVTDPRRAQGIWTHPGDTGALLEFAPPGFAPDPRLQPGWTTHPWRRHPLAIERTSHVTVLFANAERAHHVYGDLLAGELLHETRAGGVHHAYYAIGEDTVIDVAVPTDPATPEGRDLASWGNTIHRLTFASRDLDGAARFLADHGLGTTWTTAGDLHIDLPPAHGLDLALTARTIPGDPRT